MSVMFVYLWREISQNAEIVGKNCVAVQSTGLEIRLYLEV